MGIWADIPPMAATLRLKLVVRIYSASLTFKGLLVTCLNQKADISGHEAHFHRDVLSVGKDSTPIRPALFDEAEDIVPPEK